MPSQTSARQAAIKELIQKIDVSDQKQLIELLAEHYRIETNQAAISRDLRKLGLIKKMVGDVLIYQMPEIDISTEILRLALTDIAHNESMIVITTHGGMADFVGDYIDQLADLDILGCLAGENVVFVAPKSTKSIRKVYEQLCERLHFREKK